MKAIILIILSASLFSCTTALNLQKYDNQKKSISSFKLIEAPYEVNGRWFFPYDYKELIEIGTASRVYLKSGEKTKNGEVFHADVSTGAHRSLGLASNIRVTNIDNGYSMNVRVNHRGAFSNTNILELSDIVFDKLKLKDNGNLIKLELISDNETFILNEAKTYKAEKKILSNAPINDVSVVSIESSNNYEIKDIVTSTNDNIVDLNGFKIDNAINNENIYINVATLIYKENALELIKKLNVIEKVDIFQTIIDGKTVYKVVIGPFDDLFKLNQVLMNDTIQEYEDLSIFLK